MLATPPPPTPPSARGPSCPFFGCSSGIQAAGTLEGACCPALVSAGLWGTRLPGGAGGAQWAAVPTRTPLKRFPPCSGLGSGGSHETVSPSLRSQRAPSEGRVRRQRRDGGRRWEDGTKPRRRFENCHCKIWGNRSGFQAGRPPAEEERGLGGGGGPAKHPEEAGACAWGRDIYFRKGEKRRTTRQGVWTLFLAPVCTEGVRTEADADTHACTSMAVS